MDKEDHHGIFIIVESSGGESGREEGGTGEGWMGNGRRGNGTQSVDDTYMGILEYTLLTWTINADWRLADGNPGWKE